MNPRAGDKNLNENSNFKVNWLREIATDLGKLLSFLFWLVVTGSQVPRQAFLDY